MFDTYFVSGAAEDETFCRRLCTRLREVRLRAWPALEHAPVAGIGRGLASADKLIVVLSEATLGQEWLVTEVCQVRQREQEQDRRIIFPVRMVSLERIRSWSCVDPETEEDVAAVLQQYFIPDFTNWQNDGPFHSAWQRLLSDLGADED